MLHAIVALDSSHLCCWTKKSTSYPPDIKKVLLRKKPLKAVGVLILVASGSFTHLTAAIDLLLFYAHSKKLPIGESVSHLPSNLSFNAVFRHIAQCPLCLFTKYFCTIYLLSILLRSENVKIGKVYFLDLV